jgi:tetratricopeptide (TPR) repeat protein
LSTATEIYVEQFRQSLQRRDLLGIIEALRGAARVYRSRRLYDEAEDLTELRREIADRNGLAAETARAKLMLATLRHLRGDLKSAETSYHEVLEALRDAGDDEQIASTCKNLGIIANIRGDLREARSLYLESIGSAVRAGSASNTMMAYNNLGMVSADLRDWIEAEVYFDRGIEIADDLGDRAALTRLLANRAEPLIHTGDLSQALRTLGAAEALALQINDIGTLADVARFRAMIARKEGDLNTALQYVTDSLRLASDVGLDLERAEALEERACLFDAEGRANEAFSALQEAQAGYQTLGAAGDAARTREVLESWSSRMSSTASALPEVMS